MGAVTPIRLREMRPKCDDDARTLQHFDREKPAMNMRGRVLSPSPFPSSAGDCSLLLAGGMHGLQEQLKTMSLLFLTPGIDVLNLKQNISWGDSSLSIGWIRSAKSHSRTYALSTLIETKASHVFPRQEVRMA